jgi:hypothetical protein
MPRLPHLSRAVRRAAPLLAAAALAACGERGEAVRTVTRDSAGVRIAESRGEVPAERWTLSRRPWVEMHGGDTAVDAFAAVRVRAGYVVTDAERGRVARYGANGLAGPPIGGPAPLPGPFRHATWAGALRGDSVGVWDPEARRLAVYTPRLTLARFFAPSRLPAGYPGVVGAFADGSLLAAVDDDTVGPVGSGWRPARRLFRVRPDGGVLALSTVPGDATITARLRLADGEPLGFPQPLGPRTAAVAVGDAVFVGTGETYEIRKLGPGGAPSLLIRRAHRPRAVTEADRAAHRAERTRRAEGRGAEAREIERETLRQAAFPAAMPAYHAIVADSAGNLWVADHDGADEWSERSRWSVFAPDGRWIARVTGPARFTAMQVGSDWVLGVTADEDGGERVRVYGIRR